MLRTGHEMAITELDGGVRLHERRSWVAARAPGFGGGASYRRPVVVEARGIQVRIRDHVAIARGAVVGALLLALVLRRWR